MTSEDNYVLGNSDREYRRLITQGHILRPWTEHFMRAAGIVSGMSVLDLGSGIGDVSLLAANIVGPGGRVLGIDRDSVVVDRARHRIAGEACGEFVDFAVATLDEFDSSTQFDAIVGRYVLLYQADPANTLRRLVRFLRPGGIVVIHELDSTNLTNASRPRCEFWDDACALVTEAFRRSGTPPGIGERIGPVFVDAGLPWPTIETSGMVGVGPGRQVYSWLAAILQSLAPAVDRLGLTLPEGLTLDESLPVTLEKAVLSAGSQVVGPTQCGAWTRV